jgi:type IV secretion system protein VirD4
MQLPPSDEIVMVAGIHPIRTKKARYYEDARLTERILPPPRIEHLAQSSANDWSTLPMPERPKLDRSDLPPISVGDDEDSTESEKRRQPELSSKVATEAVLAVEDEFDADRDADEDPALLARNLNRSMQRVARQADLDPDDGML